MGWLVAVLPLLWSCDVAPERRRFCRAGAAAKGAGVGELAVVRALVAGRCGAAACVSEPRFAPAACGAVAAVAVNPSAGAAAVEAVAAAAARLRVP